MVDCRDPALPACRENLQLQTCISQLFMWLVQTKRAKARGKTMRWRCDALPHGGMDAIGPFHRASDSAAISSTKEGYEPLR